MINGHVDELQVINSILSNSGYTNCIMTVQEIKQKLCEEKMSVISEKPLILIEHHDLYLRLYYFLKDVEEINDIDQELLDALSEEKPIYADITTKDKFEYKGSVFEKIKLLPYRTYIRKSMLNNGKKMRNMLDTEYAQEGDVEFIFNMLIEQFDLMSDHIPDKDELSKLVSENKILKISIRDHTAGVLLFDDFGKRSYARALCVVPEYQNSFVGYSLLVDYINKHSTEKTKLFYLWVDEANENVRKLHDRFGYKYDGLNNYIFRKG